MTKKAIIVISHVPEADNELDKRIEKGIAESLKCDWLLRIEKISVKLYEKHAMPSGKEVDVHVKGKICAFAQETPKMRLQTQDNREDSEVLYQVII
ncbi:MAG: hypothetical protein QW270_03025 [Candidatus Bathyarchaeia archaeon]